MENVVKFGDLNEIELAQKLVFFEDDGVIIFQGVKTKVTTQLMQKHASYLNGVHYLPHHVNLVEFKL